MLRPGREHLRLRLTENGAMSSATPAASLPQWERLRAELVRFVSVRVREPAAADDIVHDVLVRAFDQLSGPAPPVHLEAWLYRVTRNAIVDHYRGRRPDDSLAEDLDLPAEVSAGPDDPSAERDLAACLAPLLGTLPDAYRRALTLAEVESLSQAEIARREGISLSGAKSRVQRARQKLRDAVLACCRVEIDRRGTVIDYEPADRCAPCDASGAARCARSSEVD